MIQSTKNFFYALVVHGKMKNESIDTAATAYALTIHSLIDYRMDMMTAGVVKKFGEGKSPVPKEITDYTIKDGTNLKLNQKTVTISYEGKEVTQAITVKEKPVEQLENSNFEKATAIGKI